LIRIKTKKTLALLVIFVMVFALLAACSNNNQQKNSNNNAQGNKSENTTPVKDKEVKEVKEIKELSIFFDAPWWAVKEWKGSIADKITENTGIKLKVSVAADERQLPLMIASGDLPDLVFTYDNVDRMSDPKTSYSWNELIEKYAPDFQIDKTRIAINTMEDGKFYTVKNAFATKEEMAANPFALGGDGNPGIAVREDILTELGNPSIHTLEDFTNVLGMVKQKYPDMIPLTMDINWIEPYFMQQFGLEAVLDGWYEKDGKIDYFINQPQLLDFFKYMNSLYRNGYIQSENYAYPNDQIDDQYAVNGKAFAHSHTVSTADTNNNGIEKEGGSFRFKMLPSALSEDAVRVSWGTGWAGTFITKKNKDPEASIKFLQYLASDEGKKLTMFGIEGEHWTWNNEGYPEFTYSQADSDYKNSTGISWWIMYSDGIAAGLAGYVPGTMKTQALLDTKDITIYKPEIGLIQTQPDSREKTIKTKIDEMIRNEKVKIYLAESEEEVEANFASMINNAKNMELQYLVDWANETYQKKKVLFE
jgi:putative aldouronate transport system substrate-binding protein